MDSVYLSSRIYLKVNHFVMVPLLYSSSFFLAEKWEGASSMFCFRVVGGGAASGSLAVVVLVQ